MRDPPCRLGEYFFVAMVTDNDDADEFAEFLDEDDSEDEDALDEGDDLPLFR